MAIRSAAVATLTIKLTAGETRTWRFLLSEK
jgi:hypothetical protein